MQTSEHFGARHVLAMVTAAYAVRIEVQVQSTETR